MLAQDSSCSFDELEDFLSLNLSDVDLARIESHLDTCQRCQAEVERLAAAPESWQAAHKSLSRETSSVQLMDELPPGVARDDQAAASPESVQVFDDSYLTASDDPAYLGRIAGYDVVGIVGFGAMSIVLKAFEKPLNRYVAVKVLSPVFSAHASSSKRFAREARAAAAVVHDNVISIHGISEWNGLPYLVMPYVGGESLQKRIDQNGPLELLEVLRVGHQIASGLAAAHAQGLIHRDIKPSNILLERNIDRLLITDFGLAQAADEASLTQSGIVAGTPQYMSPEQACGETIDCRSDLFSLGSLLYTLCTGHPPFRAETAFGVMRRIVDESAREIREANSSIPDWLCSVIKKLHARDPAERFEDAGVVADMLGQSIAHVQQPLLHPLPQAIVALTERSSQRKPIPTTLIAVTFVLAALAAGVFVFTRPASVLQSDVHSPSSLGSDGEKAATTETVGARRRYTFPIQHELAYLVTMSVSLPDGDAQMQGIAVVSAEAVAGHLFRLHVASNLELTQTVDHRDLLQDGVDIQRSSGGRRRWNGKIRGNATIVDTGELIEHDPQLELPFQLGTIPELIFPFLPDDETVEGLVTEDGVVTISSHTDDPKEIASDLLTRTFRTGNSEIVFDEGSVESVSATQTLTIQSENITQRIPVEVVVTRLTDDERSEWERSNEASSRQNLEPLSDEEEATLLTDLAEGRRVMHCLHRSQSMSARQLFRGSDRGSESTSYSRDTGVSSPCRSNHQTCTGRAGNFRSGRQITYQDQFEFSSIGETYDDQKRSSSFLTWTFHDGDLAGVGRGVRRATHAALQGSGIPGLLSDQDYGRQSEFDKHVLGADELPASQVEVRPDIAEVSGRPETGHEIKGAIPQARTASRIRRSATIGLSVWTVPSNHSTAANDVEHRTHVDR
jgi:serine/threonine-protein kinase